MCPPAEVLLLFDTSKLKKLIDLQNFGDNNKVRNAFYGNLYRNL